MLASVSYLPPDIMKIMPFANLRVRLNVNISIAILLDLLNEASFTLLIDHIGLCDEVNCKYRYGYVCRYCVNVVYHLLNKNIYCIYGKLFIK